MWLFMFCFGVGLQFVIVVFPDPTLAFFSASYQLYSFFCMRLSVCVQYFFLTMQ